MEMRKNREAILRDEAENLLEALKQVTQFSISSLANKIADEAIRKVEPSWDGLESIEWISADKLPSDMKIITYVEVKLPDETTKKDYAGNLAFTPIKAFRKAVK